MQNNIIQLLIIIISSTCTLFSQVNDGMKKKIIPTDNIKVAASVGADFSFVNPKKGKATIINSYGNINDENINYGDKHMSTFSLGFDIYSATSIVGLFIEPSINSMKYNITNSNFENISDSISVNNFELPIYAKMRFGKVESIGQFCIALGAGYSMTTKATTKVMDHANMRYSEFDSKKQFKSLTYLSGIIGYEFLIPFSTNSKTPIYDRDDMRILFYSKINYDLGDRLDSSVLQNNTIVGQYEDPQLRFLRVSFGVKVILRISKLAKVTGDILKSAAESKYK